MSSKDYRPWYEKVADYDSLHEREEFLKGVAGVRFASQKQVAGTLLVAGVLASYLGHRLTKSTNRDKSK